MNQADYAAAFTGEVRGIQSAYPQAHQALRNWGLWSRDRAGIFPCISRPSIWNEYAPKVGDFAEENLDRELPRDEVVKQEMAETPDYSEKEAVELDEYMHGPEGLVYAIRKCLLVAYVSLEIPEDQFPKLAGVTHEGFLMSLTSALYRIQERG
jgi:hypothetical protein